MMHVVYFRRTRYGIPSLGSIMENQGSTGYLVIQFLIIRAMTGLRRHTSYSFVWGCGLRLLGLYLDYGATSVIRALWSSVLGLCGLS